MIIKLLILLLINNNKKQVSKNQRKGWTGEKGKTKNWLFADKGTISVWTLFMN